ncbi:hypothetical protein Golomagni_04098 [Golovinomyces magnicellulatus]|nr:hypothetical protein Golomagni_04098 [Golovinomyces magnicellulatus]
MRASIIRLRFTIGLCFLLLISNVEGFPSSFNRKNEVKNWLKVRSVESSNGKILFAGEDNSCEDFSNLEAIIFTVLQESLPTLIGRCPFKTMQISTSLAAELGRVKMSNGKINQSYVTPNLPTSSELPNTLYTSKKISHSLLILIPEKIGQLSSTLISQSQSSRCDENNFSQTSIQSSRIFLDFYTHGMFYESSKRTKIRCHFFNEMMK